MSDIEFKRLPPDSGLVLVTREEAFAWMVASGRVMTVERDGQLYRVLEVGENAAPEAQRGPETQNGPPPR